MPNWCWNNVQFSGEHKNLENVGKLFKKTIDIQEKTGSGQLLFGIEESIDGYFFNINLDSGPDWLSISFESRWSPIVNDIVRIAELFNLTFTYEYEEGGNALHGKYTFAYEEGESVLYEQTPSEEEIESCRFKEEDDDKDDMTGFNMEKLEGIIEQSEMKAISIVRFQEESA
jgi:hypothetical protein